MTPAGTLGAAAAILLFTAWLVVLPSLPVSRRVQAVAAIPSLLGFASVVLAVEESRRPFDGSAGSGDAMLLAEASMLVALIVIRVAGVKGRLWRRAAIVGLAATAPGIAHQIVDYALMSMLSDANWDTPPGSGYITAGLILLSAALTASMWWRAARRAAVVPTEPVAEPPSPRVEAL